MTHPLAALLAVAAILAAATASRALAVAIVVVIVLNAAFAFAEELQAERSVEALAAYLPQHAVVVRDGHRVEIGARTLVPGGLVLLTEGDRVSADGRIVSGAQIGTAFASRTERVSLRAVGVFSNRWLLVGIASEIAFAAAIGYLPALRSVFGTAALSPVQLLLVAPFPFLVWGVDELWRARLRRG